MAGGSLGAVFGSEISKRFSSSFDELGIGLFSLSAVFFFFCNAIGNIYIVNFKK